MENKITNVASLSESTDNTCEKTDIETPKIEKFSYSRLDCYDGCHYKYKLKYVDRHYINSKSIALDFGTLIHRIEETIANRIIANEPINYDQLRGDLLLEASNLITKFPDDYFTIDKSNRTYGKKLEEYSYKSIYRLENFLKNNPDITLVGAEVPIEFEYSGHLFIGSIDRLLYNKSTESYIIQDIKTYSEPIKSADSKLITPLQFVVYALAVAEKYNCAVDTIQCQYDLPLCDIYQNAGTKGFVKRGMKKLDSLFNLIENKDWTPSPSALCYWCDYCHNNPKAPSTVNNLCPYYQNYDPISKSKEVFNYWFGPEEDIRIVENFQKKLAEKNRNTTGDITE